MKKKVLLAASVLGADLSKIGEEVREVEEGIDLVHFDVMDGHFVDNLALGVGEVRDTKTKRPKWVHLMIEGVEKYWERFVEAGADWLTWHAEVVEDNWKLISELKGRGVEPGLALSPEKGVEEIEEYLGDLGHVLVMTVEPGFGGQEIKSDVFGKIEELRERYPHLEIGVDGGIKVETIGEVAKKGANAFVVGTGIFKVEDKRGVCEELKQEARENL